MQTKWCMKIRKNITDIKLKRLNLKSNENLDFFMIDACTLIKSFEQILFSIPFNESLWSTYITKWSLEYSKIDSLIIFNESKSIYEEYSSSNKILGFNINAIIIINFFLNPPDSSLTFLFNSLVKPNFSIKE